MKRRLALWAVLLVLSAAAAVYSIREAEIKATLAPRPDTGFAGAVWAKAPADVERFYGKPLTPLADSTPFYAQAADRPGRYRSYELKEMPVLGRASRVVFTFLDDWLFNVHLFLSDTDADELDGDVRRYLIRQYGDHFSPVPDEDAPLQMVGHFSDRIVNYWLLEQGITLRPRYTAVIGIARRFVLQADGTRVDF